MPNRISISLIIALAVTAAIRVNAETTTLSQTGSASTLNQSLSLVDHSESGKVARPESTSQARTTDEAQMLDTAKTQKADADAQILPRRDLSSNESAGSKSALNNVVDLKSLGSLLIVLGLLVGVVWLMRRFIPTLRTADHTALRVVARTGLSSKHSLALVRLGRRYVLLGMGGDAVRCLCEIDDVAEVAELTAHFGDSEGSSKNFERLLSGELSEHRSTGRMETRISKRGGLDDSIRGLAGLRTKLRALKTG